MTTENNFLRSWTNELYLWYREVPDTDPTNVATSVYFDRLVTPAVTASGRDKDQFHFTYPTSVWEALSQSGVEPSYGAEWFIVSGAPPRRIVAAYVEAGSPAAAANITRGVEVLTVDGADAVNGNTQAIINVLNAGLFPESTGQSHTFTVRELSGTTRPVAMTSTNVTKAPVQNVTALQTASGAVGYLLFNDHIATSEPALINAINTLNGLNITDLILDIRYNGGGYLDIASELAYMIGGPTTAGRVFERITFNDKYPTTNPVTNQPLSPTPFHTSTKILSPTGQPLPTLNLPQPRVYVITGRGTCSASEAIINGLKGVSIDVFQIGSTTCGKPYGFYPEDNCGTTYFSIQFQGVNSAGFGSYADGFSPSNTSGVIGAPLPGCSVGDDFTRALGEPTEGRVAAALAYRASNNQSCPAASGFGAGVLSKPGQSLSSADGFMHKSPARENRILPDR